MGPWFTQLMRKLRGWLIGLIFLPAIVRAADAVPMLKREAAKCAAAWQRRDLDGIISYLPPRFIVQSGGRATVWRELREQFDQARALGAERMEARPGTPSTPRQIAPWLVSVLPVTAIMHGAHMDLTQQTHVLALSSDQGKHWFFILLYGMTQTDLNASFPELAGKIIIPTDPAPQADIIY